MRKSSEKAIAIQTKVVMLSLTFVLMVSLALSMFPTAASPWTVTETKTKTLPIAGDVTFTSSFSAASGETITITIWPVDASITIGSVVLDKATPKPKSLDSALTNIVTGEPYDGGHKIDVTLNNGQGFTTFHLWLYLSSGEHIGVNVHF